MKEEVAADSKTIFRRRPRRVLRLVVLWLRELAWRPSNRPQRIRSGIAFSNRPSFWWRLQGASWTVQRWRVWGCQWNNVPGRHRLTYSSSLSLKVADMLVWRLLAVEGLQGCNFKFGVIQDRRYGHFTPIFCRLFQLAMALRPFSNSPSRSFLSSDLSSNSSGVSESELWEGNLV